MGIRDRVESVLKSGRSPWQPRHLFLRVVVAPNSTAWWRVEMAGCTSCTCIPLPTPPPRPITQALSLSPSHEGMGCNRKGVSRGPCAHGASRRLGTRNRAQITQQNCPRPHPPGTSTAHANSSGYRKAAFSRSFIRSTPITEHLLGERH